MNKYFFNDKSSIETIDPIKEISEDNLIKNLNIILLTIMAINMNFLPNMEALIPKTEILYLTNVVTSLLITQNHN